MREKGSKREKSGCEATHGQVEEREKKDKKDCKKVLTNRDRFGLIAKLS